jgi:hypothetical protein
VFREAGFYCSIRGPLLRCRLLSPDLTSQLLSLLFHTQEFADKLATDKASLPEELKYVIDNNAPPEVQFKTAAKYLRPGVIATMSSCPYSGGPLTGFVTKTSDGTFLVKGFCIAYYNESGMQTVEYLGIDELLKLQFTCMSSTLASTVALVDKAKGDSMMAQYEGSRSMMAQVGITI